MSKSDDEAESVDRGRILAKLEEAITQIPKVVQELSSKSLPIQQIHGDFYPGNMLVIGNRIVGLFDWEESILEWRIWEVAQAIVGFCKLPVNRLDSELGTKR